MKGLIDNWALIVVFICIIILTAIYVGRFISMPTNDQLERIRQWLLFAVIQAEKELGGGTGQLKLRYVYDLFLERFPTVSSMISFTLFSELVDEALERMKKILRTNLDISAYVEGEKDGISDNDS